VKQLLLGDKMFLQHYKKHPFFYNLFILNIFWNIIRTTQWAEIQPEILIPIIKCGIIELFIVQLMIIGMIVIYKWSGKYPPVVSILTILFISIISPSILYLLAYGIKSLIWPEGNMDHFTLESLKRATYYNIFFFIAVGVIFFVTHFRMNYLKQRDLTIQSKALAKDAQLKMLRYQINPHFLFNILNSLHALVDQNQESAKKLIVDLSEYYRLILDKQILKHSIKKEIDIVTKFLEIQKIRFEKNFAYKVSVSKEVLEIKIPIFTIQILIENAIKYGRKNSENKLVIELHMVLKPEVLSIMVINSGTLTSEIKNNPETINGTGNGLDNIKQRLQRHYNNGYEFSLTENQGMVKAHINININNLS